jgi:hypothetical protein
MGDQPESTEDRPFPRDPAESRAAAPSDACERLLHVIAAALASLSDWSPIWQAEGVFMAQFDDNPAQALGRLADQAVQADLPLIDVAHTVVEAAH